MKYKYKQGRVWEQTEMIEPDQKSFCYVHYENDYSKDIKAYNAHIASLKSFPIKGDKGWWLEGVDLIEGIDFRFGCSITPCHCKDAEKCEKPIVIPMKKEITENEFAELLIGVMMKDHLPDNEPVCTCDYFSKLRALCPVCDEAEYKMSKNAINMLKADKRPYPNEPTPPTPTIADNEPIDNNVANAFHEWFKAFIRRNWHPDKEQCFKAGAEWAASLPIVDKEDTLTKAIALLKEYEQWEADLIADNKMWWPYVDKDAISGRTYEKMIELQAKRNELLKSLPPKPSK